MGNVSRRLMAGPVLLAIVGCTLFAAIPLIEARLHLPPNGAGALVLHHASGIWMWLALAWLAARSVDVLLRRVAVVSRGCLRIC